MVGGLPILKRQKKATAVALKIQLKLIYDENTLFQQFIESRSHKIWVRREQGLDDVALILAQLNLAC